MSGKTQKPEILRTSPSELHECRVCGEKVDASSASCPQCDSDEIATYLLE